MPTTENGEHVTLKYFVERIILEHDRINTMRLESARQDIQSLRQTIIAYEKSSELAIQVSREAAQKVSDKANEFRGALDDSAKNNAAQLATIKLLMSEFLSKKDYEKSRDELRLEIASLRESRSEGAGRFLGANALWSYIVAGVLLVGAVLGIVFRFVP